MPSIMINHGKEKNKATTEEEILLDKIKELKKYCSSDYNAMTELVKLMPDEYPIWNKMKDIFKNNFSDIKLIGESQLEINEKAIENNPKSYHAWYHRKYIIKELQKHDLDKILKREDILTKTLLSLDHRNCK
ncbi:Geranylgeranyl transferase type-2 subunit alpha 2 [Astathelohania contejeani]|uniref:Geranylgeranyl transferase type-2 subunit alpha n=1 Tax=Astathelohania contejeani TaxID=164912 RepID=A0ABQ7HWB8_9MICR|nr:Geranylgeranyl transferase type-2 subunit alpha 2 [Thelohania contejeani]